MDISPHLLLMAYVLLTHCLTTAMWLIGGTWMGLSRRAASEWMRASIANGIALLLTVAIGGNRSSAQLLLACTLAVLGAASMRRGLLFFLRLPHASDGFVWMAVGASAFNLLVCAPLGWTSLGICASCSMVVFVLLRCARETHGPIAHEFHPGTAATNSTLLCTGAALYVVAAATTLLGEAYTPELPSLESRQVALVFATSVLSIMVAFVQGYIVVMRLVKRLQHLSQHDSLTGLLNRRAIEQALAREAHRLQRFNEPYSVLLVDIDHFKRINDRLGHPAGDAVLCAIAQSLQGHAREVDRVARFGGEEFCVLLPHTDHDGAMQAAERLRLAIHQLDASWRNERLAVTISTGVASATDPQEPLEALLRRTDNALYRAKAEGRNRVVAAPRLRTA